MHIPIVQRERINAPPVPNDVVAPYVLGLVVHCRQFCRETGSDSS